MREKVVKEHCNNAHSLDPVKRIISFHAGLLSAIMTLQYRISYRNLIVNGYNHLHACRQDSPVPRMPVFYLPVRRLRLTSQ